MQNDNLLEEYIEAIDINGPAPETEPDRQYYFIKKCREYVKKKEEELGRRLISHTTTFGCQMNFVTENA